MLGNVTVKWTDDSQSQHMCLMQTNNFYKYKPHSSFCKIFSCWLVVGFQNPAPEAGRLLKTAQVLDRSKHVCAGALPRRLRETNSRAAPALRPCRGRQRETGRPRPPWRAGIPAGGAARAAAQAPLPPGARRRSEHAFGQESSLCPQLFDFPCESAGASLQI